MNGTMLRLALAASAAAALAATPSTALAKSTHHRVADRNHDRIPDTWERKFKLSLKVNQAHRDQDHDGLNNRAEFLANTSPVNSDTDQDGVPDGQEHAGRVVSFDGTTLVVALFGGTQTSATVNSGTEIQCETGATVTPPVTPAPARKTSARDGSNENSGSNETEDDNNDDSNEDTPPVPGTTPVNGGSHGSGEHGSGDHGSGSGTPGQTTPPNQGGDDNSSDGSDDSGDGEHGGNSTCVGDALSLLVPGAVVHEGSIEVANGQAVWHEITVVI